MGYKKELIRKLMRGEGGISIKPWRKLSSGFRRRLARMSDEQARELMVQHDRILQAMREIEFQHSLDPQSEGGGAIRLDDDDGRPAPQWLRDMTE